jgi:hypothetical protein
MMAGFLARLLDNPYQARRSRPPRKFRMHRTNPIAPSEPKLTSQGRRIGRAPNEANAGPNEPNGGLGGFSKRAAPGKTQSRRAKPTPGQTNPMGVWAVSRSGPRRAKPNRAERSQRRAKRTQWGFGRFPDAGRAEQTRSRRTKPTPGQTNPMGVWASSQRSAVPSEPNRAEQTQVHES